MMQKLAYAPRLERFIAYIIDSMFLMLPLVFLSNFGAPESALVVIGIFASDLVYHTVFTASEWQATPGQRIMNMHVTRLDGRLLTERDAVERFLAYQMPRLPMYLSIASFELRAVVISWLVIAWFAPILLRDDRRGVHDVICNTAVVNGKR